MDVNSYNTIEKPGTAEFKDRGSRFIAFAFPLNSKEEFKNRLAQLKKEHPKAAHHCFAYRLGTDGNEFRVGDDGEPSGSAGRPMLGQIDSKQLTNLAVIVVRYFGGTLLGVPGLINAYKSSTAMVLEAIPVKEKAVLVKYKLEFDYTQMNDVMRIVKRTDCIVLKQELQLFYSMEIGIPKTRFEETLSQFKELNGVNVEVI